jgi:hypothetical protein
MADENLTVTGREDSRTAVTGELSPGAPARRRAVLFLAVAAGLAAGGMLTPRRAEACYCPCSKCKCCGFEGSDVNCTNCGHTYGDHFGTTCAKGG